MFSEIHSGYLSYYQVSVSDVDDTTSSDVIGEFTSITAKLFRNRRFCGEQLLFSLVQYACPLLALFPFRFSVQITTVMGHMT